MHDLLLPIMKISIKWGNRDEPQLFHTHERGSKRVHLSGPGITYPGWYRIEGATVRVGETAILKHVDAGKFVAVRLIAGDIVDACGPLLSGDLGWALRGDYWPAGNYRQAEMMNQNAAYWTPAKVELCPTCHGDGCPVCKRLGVVGEDAT